MKIILLVLSLFVFAQCIQSQNKMANNWFFGDDTLWNNIGIGLNFNTDTPSVLLDCPTYFNNCTASISDTSGNLLFYANNSVVLNANHDTMPNGNIKYTFINEGSSSIIIPKPGSESLYYLITVFGSYPYELYYSVIDMEADNGLGDVIEKNTLLYKELTVRLAATYHANGKDVWLVSHQLSDSVFVSFLITENGIDTVPVKSYIGINQNYSYNSMGGQLKFSASGTKLGIAVGSSTTNGRIELFNFNKETGEVNNQIFRANYNNPNGIEFSPSEEYLYVSGGGVSQYNITLGSDSLIINSRVVIGTSGYMGMQIAPDGKIYINEIMGSNIQQYLKTISYPDSAGLACGYGNSPINLSDYGKRVRAGFPNFISNYFDFSTGVESPKLSDRKFEVYPNPASSRITIISKQLSENGNKFVLYDLFGKEVLSTEIKEQTIDISQVPQGVYVYKISDNIGILKNGKIVIMR